MRRIYPFALLVLTLGLGGCATPPSSYGNFVQEASQQQFTQLATDTVRQLAALYAPAHTRLELLHQAPDPFGQALIKALRDRGYAVLEFAPPAAPASSVSQSGSLSLSYILDNDDKNLYRLTLMVGCGSITRPYLVQNGMFAPAGPWVRKE